ncbi:aldehyde dehydrogenase, partial [mine drainage metagenome]
ALGLNDTHSGTYLGQGAWSPPRTGGMVEVRAPHDGSVLGHVQASSAEDYEQVVRRAEAAFKEWRQVPAPRRGEAVRLCGEALRKHKDALGSLVALEMGKIKPEGDG